MRLVIVAAAMLTMPVVRSPAEAEETCAAHQPGKAPPIKYCKPGGKFDDCTSAQCTKGDKKGTWNCTCNVMSNTGTVTDAAKDCREVEKVELQSRYQPVATLGLCPGQDKAGAQITWAWCLGKACNWADSGTTTCTCDETNSKAQSSSQYLLVTPLTAANCSDKKVYSSATLDQIFAATSLLRCNGISTPDPKVQWLVTGP